MITSEEKMRASFEAWVRKDKSFYWRWLDRIDGDPEYCAGDIQRLWEAWQAALQESEAVAQPIAYLYRDDEEMLLSSGRCVVYEEEQEFSLSSPQRFKPLYLAPQSAQAIETAAIMRAAAAVACPGRTIFDTEKAILALIPQDGRTALEKFGMKVATETRSAVLINTREDLFTEDSSLRAIVTNLIGAAK